MFKAFILESNTNVKCVTGYFLLDQHYCVIKKLLILNGDINVTNVTKNSKQEKVLYTMTAFFMKVSKYIQCKHCGKKLNCKTNLDKHVLNIHDGIKQNHKCKDCEKIFTQKTGLKSHVQSVHMKIKHKCERCNKDFSSKSTLSRHYKSFHTGNLK